MIFLEGFLLKKLSEPKIEKIFLWNYLLVIYCALHMLFTLSYTKDEQNRMEPAIFNNEQQ